MSDTRRRLLALVLLVAMALGLTACGAQGGRTEPEPQAPSAEEQPAEEQPAEEQPAEELPWDESQMAELCLPLEPMTSLEGREGLKLPASPQRRNVLGALEEEYAGNVVAPPPREMDLYPDQLPDQVIRFWYLTKYAIQKPDLDRFQADLGIASSYTCSIRSEYALGAEAPEWGPQLDAGAQPNALPYYVYLTARGADWQALAALYEAARNDPEDAAARQAWEEAYGAYLEDFRALQAEDLPAFHSYLVEIRFTPTAEGGQIYDETCTEINTEGGLWSQIGVTARIHTQMPRVGSGPGLKQKAAGFTAPLAPLCDGLVTCRVMEFTTEEDVTLTDLGFSTKQLELCGAELERTTATGTVTTPWDGQSPLALAAGEEVRLTVTVRDKAACSSLSLQRNGLTKGYDREAWAKREEGDWLFWTSLSLYDYSRTAFCTLGYDRAGARCETSTGLQLKHELNLWELAIGNYLGWDTAPYYIWFYNPCCNEAWRRATPLLPPQDE